MSLAIDVDKVVRVLLVDGWHHIEEKSFIIDAYEYLEGGEPVLRGGQNKLVCSAGASWKNKVDGGRDIVFCPLTSVLAVTTKEWNG